MNDAAEEHIPTPWLGYQGFEACIIINDVAVTRFGAEYCQSKDEACAWIASESNKTFVVDYRKIVADDYDYCMTLYLDGKKVACAVVSKKNGNKTYRISFIPVSATETRSFKFSSAALTDDDVYLDNPLSTGIGEIKVVLQASKVTAETKPPDTSYSEPVGAAKIHERLNKGLAHQIGYETKTERPAEVPRKWLLYEPIGKPVTLIFRYRSLDWLQARGIAPRSETPSEEENDIEASVHQFPKMETPVEEKPTRNTSPGVKREDTANDVESEEEDIDQIVIKSLRTLLFKLEKVADRKRTRREIHDQTSKKVEKAPIKPNLVMSEAADSTARQEVPPRPQKKAKNSHPTPAKIIDLTWL